jgi:hypothetical protein
MHGACLLSRYTQSVVNRTDGHQADGKAFGCSFDKRTLTQASGGFVEISQLYENNAHDTTSKCYGH